MEFVTELLNSRVYTVISVITRAEILVGVAGKEENLVKAIFRAI